MPVRSPRFIQHHTQDTAAEREAAAAGLMRTPATASPKFFYDSLGSHLFDAITELSEYYPTRTEAALFRAHGAEMAQCIGASCTLIDLGAGDCAKAARLFPLLDPRRYIAIDISANYLREAMRRLQRENASIEMTGVGMDFTQSPRLPSGLLTAQDRPAFFFPGSSIGNFTPNEALEFLTAIHEQAHGGGLLIGIDLVKDRATMERAYDDALGVTAAFNLNALRQLNRLLGADFDPRQWTHQAFFNAEHARIEMHLQARVDQTVRWPGGVRRFEQGERIHTENSYKYTVPSFEALLNQAGFARTQCWSAPFAEFAVFWATA